MKVKVTQQQIGRDPKCSLTNFALVGVECEVRIGHASYGKVGYEISMSVGGKNYSIAKTIALAECMREAASFMECMLSILGDVAIVQL